MKILHTSDWHIGKRLNGREMEDVHKLFFNWLIDTINQEKIEKLIVAGDIFDLAYPSNSSLRLYYETLRNLQTSHCNQIIITAGNHDSVSTINAPRQILEYMNIHVIGGVFDHNTDYIIPLNDKNNNTKAVVCAIPYLRERDIRKSIPGETFDERVQAIKEGTIAFYNAIRETAKKKYNSCPKIATGHFFLSGGKSSESERELNIGTLERIKATEFDAMFDYLAMGHLHKPQIIGRNDKIQYSGSPVSLSFSERNDKKRIVVLEIDENKNLSTKHINIPEFRKLVSVKGSFDEVKEKIDTFSGNENLIPWISVEIEEETIKPNLVKDFELYAENLNNVEIVTFKIKSRTEIEGADSIYEETTSLKDMAIADVFEKLLEKEEIENRDEYKKSFDELQNWRREKETE